MACKTPFNSNAPLKGNTNRYSGNLDTVALTHDQRIITWGVNDLGALGRDTTVSVFSILLPNLSSSMNRVP
jgi:alpha-tubulin suppressor-like RCC1 family protein